MVMVDIFGIIGVVFLWLGDNFSSSEMKRNNEAIVRLVFAAISAYFLSAASFLLLAKNHPWLGGLYAIFALWAIIMVFLNFIEALKNR